MTRIARIVFSRFMVALAAGFMLMCGSAQAAGLEDFKSLQLPEGARAAAGAGQMSVMFMGVTTLLFDDGETAVMIDGYFSRPTLAQLPRIAPDRARITQSLQRAGVKTLAAVIPVHSHFDHALDSPRVALDTGALLVGSMATANIGRGQGLPEASIRVVNPGDSLSFGKFKVTFIKSAHFPAEFGLGDITAPLSFPAKASDMKMGEVFALLIEHSGRSVLLQGSAGFNPGALQGKKADVVYLGIGGLASKDQTFQDTHWRENVASVAARRVVPVHWDNFYFPLDVALVPAPGFDRAMNGLIERGKKDNVEIRLQTEWLWVDPFTGLAR
jgi:L-ascorbate metabolism protein UlaG (beta-lactamase superfamily)